MDNIKYTKDGKKVVVLGNLNDSQMIVQEIFIINNQEIPQGKNFVVSDLYDAPAESWQAQRTREIVENYRKTEKEYEDKIRDLRNTLGKRQEALQMKLSYLYSVDKADNVAQHFNKVLDLLTGKIKWAVCTNGWSPRMKEVNDEYFLTTDKNDRHLRMISMFGRDQGTLEFKYGQYADGSGSDESVLFFEDKNEALLKLRELLNAKEKISEYDLAESEKWGVYIDTEKVNAFKAEKIAALQKAVDQQKGYLESAIEKLNEYDKK